MLKALWARARVRRLVRLLAVFYLLAAFADFIAPYAEGDETSHLSFQPPNRVRVFREGRLVRPYIYGLGRTLDTETFTQVWLEDRTRVYPVHFFVRRAVSVSGVDLRYVPFPLSLVPEPLRARWGVAPSASLHLFGVDDPDDRVRLYLWGADGFGGDVFGNVLFGGRVSLTLGVLAALLCVPIGVGAGLLAAVARSGRALVLGLADAVAAIPSPFWVLLLTNVFSGDGSGTATYLFLVLSVAATGWGTLARGVYARLRTLDREEFALAATALGNGRRRVLLRHLLPHTASYVAISAGVLVPTFVLLESLVSFFGFGIEAPARSWGLLLAELMGVSPAVAADRGGSTTGLFEVTRYPWLWLPGMCLCLANLSFVLLAEELRDALDPRG